MRLFIVFRCVSDVERDKKTKTERQTRPLVMGKESIVLPAFMHIRANVGARKALERVLWLLISLKTQT